MAIFALLIGVVLIVAAVRNSQGALFSAIQTDVPEFFVWAAAIVALGIIGYVPGLKPISKALLALVIIVLLVGNYQNILSGFQNAWQKQEKKTPPSAGSAVSGTPSYATQTNLASNDNATSFGGNIFQSIGQNFPNPGGNLFSILSSGQ